MYSFETDNPSRVSNVATMCRSQNVGVTQGLKDKSTGQVCLVIGAANYPKTLLAFLAWTKFP